MLTFDELLILGRLGACYNSREPEQGLYALEKFVEFKRGILPQRQRAQFGGSGVLQVLHSLEIKNLAATNRDRKWYVTIDGLEVLDFMHRLLEI